MEVMKSTVWRRVLMQLLDVTRLDVTHFGPFSWWTSKQYGYLSRHSYWYHFHLSGKKQFQTRPLHAGLHLHWTRHPIKSPYLTDIWIQTVHTGSISQQRATTKNFSVISLLWPTPSPMLYAQAQMVRWMVSVAMLYPKRLVVAERSW